MPDIVTGKIFVDGEKGITATKMNQIIGQAVIQPDFVGTKPAASSIATSDQLLVLQTANTYARAPFSAVSASVAGSLPVADATQNGMLRQVSGNTTDVVDGTNHCVPIASMSGITQMRLRSFSSIGNPNFECDSRNCGTAVGSGFGVDRWVLSKTGTMVVSGAQQNAASSEVLVPGTNFAISQKFYRITLTTTQATLGASDNVFFRELIEGPVFRELQYDVHSTQVLVRSSVAGLTFGLYIQDNPSTKSLVKLCTIPTANAWTLLPYPSLPVFPSGNFTTVVGAVGYIIGICLAAGTSFTAPANDAWQNGNFIGAVGQSNFANNATGSTFDIAFVQHEPGQFCTTLIDKPFTQNYGECLRYFYKTMPYGVKPGPDGTGFASFHFPAAVSASTPIEGGRAFPVPLCKAPTVSFYKHDDGTLNQGYYYNASTSAVVAFNGNISNEKAVIAVYPNANISGPIMVITGFTADTGF